jgi:hypothetical protein
VLGLAAALSFAFFGLRACWIVVVGGGPQTPFSRNDLLVEALGFLLRVGVLCCAVAGGETNAQPKQ